MKPKTKMYIDARNEKIHMNETKQIAYKINGADGDEIKQKIFDSVGLHSIKIEIIPKTEKVIITYNENYISPSYMEYKFNHKGLTFKRVE
ncbi:hypothetical protein F8154_03260 [Alkaliphilus pronyensis]|uniref:Uncharacterized protein n=1 Tax=Alkaliphilus pronyensis TaxID=1482732 RepID=A0A6I0FGH1_9FIRM|nr:hypothetical protein [Alkaliphilus pronyensis]KAB3537323.1 hypothetical protein F8154_03260 [Alkaliphilus pronyensis]